jgi:hypothetical protein
MAATPRNPSSATNDRLDGFSEAVDPKIISGLSIVVMMLSCGIDPSSPRSYLDQAIAAVDGKFAAVIELRSLGMVTGPNKGEGGLVLTSPPSFSGFAMPASEPRPIR